MSTLTPQSSALAAQLAELKAQGKALAVAPAGHIYNLQVPAGCSDPAAILAELRGSGQISDYRYIDNGPISALVVS